MPFTQRSYLTLKALAQVEREFTERTLDLEHLIVMIARKSAETVDAFCALRVETEQGEVFAPALAGAEGADALAALSRLVGSRSIVAAHAPADDPGGATARIRLVDVDDALLARELDGGDLATARALGVRGVLVAPLRMRGVTFGTLAMARFGAESRPFDGLDVDIAGLLADQAAMAIANARALDAERRARLGAEQAQSALRASEERYRRIVEATSEGVWIIDAEGRTAFANERLAQMLGYARAEEVLGTSYLMFVPADEREHAEARQHARRRGVRGQYESRLLRRDGAAMWVLYGATPLMSDDGRFEGTLAMMMDITQRKEAERERDRLEAALRRELEERRTAEARLRKSEEQLLHAQKMEAVGRLAGGVAHDFNNLLTVILSNTEILLDELRPDDAIREDVEQIRQAGERAADLTRQLLAFSRKQVLEPRVLDLGEVVAGMAGLLGRLLGEDIRLAIVPAEVGLWRCVADPGQLEQVVMNLAVNARDAMPEGGLLTIETRNVFLDAAYAAEHSLAAPGAHVLLAVSDTGQGMNRETQSRIFEPFFTTKDQARGTGLGLSTVFGIVQQSGGHIWVYSEPGEGTTFKIYLPRASTQSAMPVVTPSAAPETSHNSETILVAEDEAPVREIVCVALRGAGYTVLETSSAEEALRVERAHPGAIDLLVTDVVMTGLGGRLLAERLRPLRPGLRVLFMSGYTEDAIIRHGVLASGVAFLAKPVTPSSLLRKVRSVLDAARAV